MPVTRARHRSFGSLKMPVPRSRLTMTSSTGPGIEVLVVDADRRCRHPSCSRCCSSILTTGGGVMVITSL